MPESLSKHDKAITLVLLIPFPLLTYTYAFDNSLAAYNKKDYATAYMLWKPLADKTVPESNIR